MTAKAKDQYRKNQYDRTYQQKEKKGLKYFVVNQFDNELPSLKLKRSKSSEVGDDKKLGKKGKSNNRVVGKTALYD